MSDRLKQIRRIQKLQALARGEAEGGNTIAAENAARIAAKLMVAHAISAIEVSTPIEDDPMVAHSTAIGRQLVWLRQLFHCVALANNCTTSYRTGTDTVTIYGTRSDCEVAEYLAIHLSREVQKRADQYMKELRCDRDAQNRQAGWNRYDVPRGARRDFCHSAVAALNRRLQIMRRDALKAATAEHGEHVTSGALVVLDNKLRRAEAFADTHNLRAGRSARYHHSAAGAEAGRAINIHKGIGGRAPHALT